MLPIKIQLLMERASGRVLGMVKSLGKLFNTSKDVLLLISLPLPFFSFPLSSFFFLFLLSFLSPFLSSSFPLKL